MSEEKSVSSVAHSQERPSPARKPYSTPRLTELGSLAQLTKGGDVEQRGEGPGFSL